MRTRTKSLAIGVVLCCSTMAVAGATQRKLPGLQDALLRGPGADDQGIPLGMKEATPAAGGGALDLGDILPGVDDNGNPLVFQNTRFAINGVSLRNCKRAGINLIGVPPSSTIVAAYLYWGWAGLAAPVAGAHDTVRLKRFFPKPRNGAVLTGTLVGTGGDPCWAGAGTFNWVYRADVLAQAKNVVAGPAFGAKVGTWNLALQNAALGQKDYTDPWGFPGPTVPLAEGATLLVVYTNNDEAMGTTVIYDSGLAGALFFSFPGLIYNLIGFPPAVSEARWANSGMDGQSGAGYPAILESGHEMSIELNFGTPIAGGGPFGLPSLYNDSDWNGSASKPLGQLWDVSGHDITGAAIGVPSFPMLFLSPGVGGADCLVPVCNVMWTR